MTGIRGTLSREQIVAAALELVDEQGAEQLSMRRLGQRLGVDPMAIYHHLPNKSAVLDGIVEAIWGGIVAPSPVPGETWQEILVGVFTAFRRRLLEHPRAISIVSARTAATPAMFALIDTTIGRVEAAGMPGAEAMPLIDSLSAFTLGKLLGEASATNAEGAARLRESLQAITPASHPHLVATLAGGYGPAPREQFDRGLRALIAGWTASA